MAEKKNQSLREKIDSQKGTSTEFRPTTRLDPETGHEESRTGRRTDKRDIRPEPAPEEDSSQNAIGGKVNR